MMINQPIGMSELELRKHVTKFGDHILALIKKRNIAYVVPVETKGTLLLEEALGNRTLPDGTKLIYNRAFRYLSKAELATKRILILDDIFFSGRNLRDLYEEIQSYGCAKENIEMVAFLDFSSGIRDKNYEGEVHDLILKNSPPDITPIKKDDTLLLLQHAMLSSKMPSTYDHLTVEIHNVDEIIHHKLLSRFNDLHRLLFYGQRGVYITSSILLSDIFDKEWDVPAKIRLWWNKNDSTLRISPVGFVSCINAEYHNLSSDRIYNALLPSSVDLRVNQKAEIAYEAAVINCRIKQLVAIKSILSELDLELRFDSVNFDRYYPSLGIDRLVSDIYNSYGDISLPRIDAPCEDYVYYSATNEVLKFVKAAWDNQPSIQEKDRTRKGYTASEIFNYLKDYTAIQLHAAIDYCFDYHYLAAFRADKNGNYCRCYRTTEIFSMMANRSFEEIFGSAVIYGRTSQYTPDWLLNKIFAIIRNMSPKLDYDGKIVICKHYYGDVSRIVRSESTSTAWKEIETDLWETHENEGGVISYYKHDVDQKAGKEAISCTMDTRLSGYRDVIAAVDNLLDYKNSRPAGVLLDILSGRFGGADYIAYNLEHLLEYGSLRASADNIKAIKHHTAGVKEKLSLIKTLGTKSNPLNAIRKRCENLNSLPLIQLLAQNIIDSVRFFREPLIYNALEKLRDVIMQAAEAAQNNNKNNLLNILKDVGIRPEDVDGINNPKQLLAISAKQIHILLYALAARTCGWSYYNEHTVRPSDSMSFILAYDLTSARRAGNQNLALTNVDNALHILASNWIIAFDGTISTYGQNAGDLRYGFFNKLENALHAGCWILHHAEQLSHTNQIYPGAKAYGIVITHGRVAIDQSRNATGETMDTAGHFLKGKLEKIAGLVGRTSPEYAESQLWLLEHDHFNADRSTQVGLSKAQSYIDGSETIMLSALDVDSVLKNKPMPWIA
jgi:hypothetical protein